MQTYGDDRPGIHKTHIDFNTNYNENHLDLLVIKMLLVLRLIKLDQMQFNTRSSCINRF